MQDVNQSQRIADLEAQVKFLQRQLKEAQAIIEVKNKKMHSEAFFASHEAVETEIRKEKHLTDERALSNTSEEEIDLNEIASQLHKYILEDKAKRLENHIRIEALLDVHKTPIATELVTEDINKIIETVSWTKGIIKAKWYKSLDQSDAAKRFVAMLPTFFRVLSAWQTSGFILTNEKVKQLQHLRYNHYAYKILFEEISPNLVEHKPPITHQPRKPVDPISGDVFKYENNSDRKKAERRKLLRSQISVRQEERASELEKLQKAREQKHRNKKSLELRNKNIKMITQEAAKKKQDTLRQKNWMRLYSWLKNQLGKHAPTLLRNYRRSYEVNDYGAVEKDQRGPEIYRFFNSIGLYDFDGLDPYCAGKASRLTQRWCERQLRKSKEASSVPDNGQDFEHWVADKLIDNGWKAHVTKASGDDGVDVIAERQGVSVAVQCKRYKGSVGNKAVQEVYSGMKHMQLARAVVISTGKYTKSAQNLARTTGVLLLSERDVQNLWDLIQ